MRWFLHERLAARASVERPGEGDGQSLSQGGDRVFDVALGSDRGRLGVVDDGEGQGLPAAGVLRGKGRSLADQESIGGDAERGVVMESSPAAPFEVGEAEFALEFLIVAFDAPAQFRGIDENFDRSVSGKVESQYLVGSRSSSGHSQQPFERLWGR